MFEQPPYPPVVVLQVLTMLRIHCIHLTVYGVCTEHRGDEELGKTVESFSEVVRIDSKMVVGVLTGGVSIVIAPVRAEEG